MSDGRASELNFHPTKIQQKVWTVVISLPIGQIVLKTKILLTSLPKLDRLRSVPGVLVDGQSPQTDKLLQRSDFLLYSDTQRHPHQLHYLSYLSIIKIVLSESSMN